MDAGPAIRGGTRRSSPPALPAGCSHALAAPTTGRRDALRALIAAPLLQLLPWAGGAAPATAQPAGPRFLTPEQQAAVDAAFAATLPKSKVGRSARMRLVHSHRGARTSSHCRPGPCSSTPHPLAACQAPVMVRLVFHDAGSYSAAAGDGGLNASIRFELDRPDNFGLKRGWCAGGELSWPARAQRATTCLPLPRSTCRPGRLPGRHARMG